MRQKAAAGSSCTGGTRARIRPRAALGAGGPPDPLPRPRGAPGAGGAPRSGGRPPLPGGARPESRFVNPSIAPMNTAVDRAAPRLKRDPAELARDIQVVPVLENG